MGDTKWPSASLMAELSEGDREALVRLGTSRVYEAGEVLIAEGQHDSHAVLLLDGCVKVVGLRDDGGSVLLAVRTRGDLVGEFSAIDGRPRSATVIAARTTPVRTIGAADFHAFLRERPWAAEAVQRSITRKLRSATRYRIDTSGGSVTARVARTLDTLVRTYGRVENGSVRIDLPLSQGDLAALAGVSQAGAQRALRHLRAAEVVTTEYRGTVVRNLAALRRAAEEGGSGG
ncbi:Crp/Fnr family transcriptional regulator [Streptomyces sp. GMY02]|uniref:Crp/Fnr family transcriptional regulator n=1 Tax=Streptomyces sp. GMY02 TaxID=1333528 RepID=UPI001C2C8967|nr:Crp/Fnr family transcriptional regulator [Streptomyces sp. GMY02]QXE33490.1 Crp/Fnr family transcriptional regulator [Streptomyces sp. GMY02]